MENRQVNRLVRQKDSRNEEQRKAEKDRGGKDRKDWNERAVRF